MSPRPLEGRVVVITRRPEQSAELRQALEARGATVLELPAVEIAPPTDPGPLDAALQGLEGFGWVAFTSANAVRAVADRLGVLGLPLRISPRGPSIAAVGQATAHALGEAFPDDPVALRPAGDEHAQGLVQAFVRRGVGGARVLLPTSSRGRTELEEGLRAASAQVERVVAYETRWPPGLASDLDACLSQGPDLFVFASPSAVQGLAGPRLEGRKAVVIGPTTEAAAREAGLRILGVAASPGATALADAVALALAPPAVS
jgi:uroporphyrinogen-III synthase